MSIRELQHPEAFGGWLATIARNVARTKWRAEEETVAAHRAIPADVWAVDDPSERVECQEVVRHAQEMLQPM
jgi:DNA-directed RNA polymerase specialized sigma24 family protein